MSEPDPKTTVAELGLDHRNCSFSSGIDEFITAGQGELDWCGWFSIPCPECAERVERKLECRNV